MQPFLAQTHHRGVTRKASLPRVDAAKTDTEGKRRVLRYKYVDIYLGRDLIVQSCMPYGHAQHVKQAWPCCSNQVMTIDAAKQWRIRPVVDMYLQYFLHLYKQKYIILNYKIVCLNQCMNVNILRSAFLTVYHMYR